MSERAHSPPPVAHKSANLYQKDGKTVKKDRENVKISRTFPKILEKLTQIGLPQSIGSLASLKLHRRGKEASKLKARASPATEVLDFDVPSTLVTL